MADMTRSRTPFFTQNARSLRALRARELHRRCCLVRRILINPSYGSLQMQTWRAATDILIEQSLTSLRLPWHRRKMGQYPKCAEISIFSYSSKNGPTSIATSTPIHGTILLHPKPLPIIIYHPHGSLAKIHCHSWYVKTFSPPGNLNFSCNVLSCGHLGYAARREKPYLL